MNAITTFTAGGAAKLPSVLIKVAMALSGMGLALWLTLHMAGNMLWLLGPSVMDAYGTTLHASGVLWPVRLLLVGGLLVHIAGALLTTRRAHAARPVTYRKFRPNVSSFASRSMRWTGVMIFGFVLYHVASVYGMVHEHVRGAFHHNLSALLLQPWDALILSASAGLVATHLGHGLASAFVSLGMISPKHESLVRRSMRIWACVVTAGFLLLPLVFWAQRLLAVGVSIDSSACALTWSRSRCGDVLERAPCITIARQGATPSCFTPARPWALVPLTGAHMRIPLPTRMRRSQGHPASFAPLFLPRIREHRARGARMTYNDRSAAVPARIGQRRRIQHEGRYT